MKFISELYLIGFIAAMNVSDATVLDEFTVTENVTYNMSESFDGEWQDSLWKHVIEDFKRTQLTLHEPTTIVLMVLYVPIFFTSLVGNVLVLLVIVPNQRMWTVTNNFLVNLAVADLLGIFSELFKTFVSSMLRLYCIYLSFPMNLFRQLGHS